MKVFVSWSGQRSKVVAEIFSDWLKCVIQASQPWISTRDIDRGAIWFSEINDKLKDVSVGVVCLTQENKNKPWILFETGALAKGLTTNRVCTFLIDLNPEDLQDPLAQFNHTTPNNHSVWELTRTINACLVDKALDERILRQVFDTYWPQFEASFNAALVDNPPQEVIPPRTEQDILTEILNNTRTLNQRVRILEANSNELNTNNITKSNLTKKEVHRLQSQLDSIMLSGLYNEDEIMASLDIYSLPEDYIRDRIRYNISKYRHKNIKVNIE
ncbi:TPA: TIR domain-containing protein [Escherichia coli]|uniref:TIR domain-containing protein n=1 Tax=Citrobacter TaxID=544 RepID=UPI000BAE37FB|nr:TIR domain-containing protein [Citrobacter sp. TSA-1]PAX81100.1 toll-Interleukin receptor [Citrobacter sp. TSA-1]QKE19205.1 TIR domain-containing protein [Citrobacter sp. TSA-1]